jgi:hypothetical protein
MYVSACEYLAIWSDKTTVHKIIDCSSMTLIMVVNMKIMVSWDVKPCSLVNNAHVFRPGHSITECTIGYGQVY